MPMSSKIIRVEPLTAARFSAFGTVLETGGQTSRLVNQGAREGWRVSGLVRINRR